MKKNKILFLEALYLQSLLGYRIRFKDPLAGVDIEKEYELIQQKNSNLSANLRNMVVNRYEILHKTKKGGKNEH